MGKLPVPGRLLLRMIVGQGPIALAVGAGRVFFWIFLLWSIFSLLFLPLCEMARYRLKYCLKGPFNPKQPMSQIKIMDRAFGEFHIVRLKRSLVSIS